MKTIDLAQLSSVTGGAHKLPKLKPHKWPKLPSPCPANVTCYDAMGAYMNLN